MTLCTIIYTGDTSGDDGNGGTNVPSTPVTDTSTGETISTATSTTQTFSNPVDLSAMADDGSDVIWIDTPTGERHLFRITGWSSAGAGITEVDSVTTAEAAVGTDSTLAWGIGGKRSTLESDTGNPDFHDGLGGWVFELEANGANYTFAAASLPITPTGGDTTNGAMVVRGVGGRPVLLSENNGDFFNVGACTLTLIDLLITLDAPVASTAYRLWETTGNNLSLLAIRCKFNARGTARCFTVDDTAVLHFIQCEFAGGTASTAGLYCNNNRHGMILDGCISHGNGGGGFALQTNFYAKHHILRNCLSYDNGGDGYKISVSTGDHAMHSMTNCVAHGNGAAAVSIIGTLDKDSGPIVIMNCIFTDCAYGVQVATPTTAEGAMKIIYADFNAYHGITSSEVDGMIKGPNSITLSANPFVSPDTPNFNFALNATAGGGAACKAVGVPNTWPVPVAGNSPSATDLGAVAFEAVAGGIPTYEAILLAHPF